MVQEENTRIKKKFEEVVTERNGLKMQCTSAFQQWNTALGERNEFKDQAHQVAP